MPMSCRASIWRGGGKASCTATAPPGHAGWGFLFEAQPAKWHSTSPSSRLVMRGAVVAQGAKQAGQRG